MLELIFKMADTWKEFFLAWIGVILFVSGIALVTYTVFFNDTSSNSNTPPVIPTENKIINNYNIVLYDNTLRATWIKTPSGNMYQFIPENYKRLT